MVKARAALVLALAVSARAAATAVAPPARDFGDHLAELAAMGDRRENGPGERAAIAYIEATLREAGIPTSVGDFSAARGGYSASRVVEAVIPGELRDELVFIAPLNSWQDARSGQEGAAGIASALSEAERVAASGRRPALSLRFVFLGAERRGRAGDGEEASLGTRTWIAALSAAPRRAVVYLSLDSGFSALALRNAGKGLLSPLWLFDSARKALEGAGVDPVIEANRLLFYRLGLADEYGPVAPYLAAGIPAVELRSLPADDAVPIRDSQVFGFVDALIKANSGGFPEFWDLHYLIFEIGRLSATVRETAYVAFVVIFLAAASALLLTLTITRRSRAKPILARMPSAFGQAAALYAALVVVYLAGSVITRLDALVLGSGEAWRLTPRVFAGARIVSSFLLFLALISLLVERGALTSNPYFYEFAALLCLGIDVFVFSAVNLPVSFFFLWAFAVVLLSLAARRGWATIAAYGFMYAPLLLLAFDLAIKPEYAIYRRIIAPGAAGTLALAALSLPFFVFTASPLLFFAPHGTLARKRAALLLVALAVAVEGGALAVSAYRGSPGAAPRIALAGGTTISEAIDQDGGSFSAFLSGPGRLGTGTITRGSLSLPFSARGDSVQLEGRDAERRIACSQSRTFFLDRCTDKIRITFTEPPFRLELVLRGEGELGIYDCGLPYRVSLDGRSAEVFAAVNPGAELSFPVTVPRSFAANLEIAAEYLEPVVPYAFPDGTAPRPGRFTVRATIPLAGGD